MESVRGAAGNQGWATDETRPDADSGGWPAPEPAGVDEVNSRESSDLRSSSSCNSLTMKKHGLRTSIRQLGGMHIETEKAHRRFGATTSRSFTRIDLTDHDKIKTSGMLTSRNLSESDLQQLCKVSGSMPKISTADIKVSANEIVGRVEFLDRALQERAQSICERIVESCASRELLCRLSCPAVLGHHCSLGVIAEIWPAIIFFTIYTLAVEFYAHSQNWELEAISARYQDIIYYPGMVLAFLLSFRASDCMQRYQAGCKFCFEMEKNLRELAFEVVSKLSLDEDPQKEVEARAQATQRGLVSRSVKRQYFKHEFRRLSQLLFACAARDLSDSAQQLVHADPTAGLQLVCTATDVEHSAIRVTHSAYGHVFRVYLVAAWLRKLVHGIAKEDLFDDDKVCKNAETLLRQFNTAWFHARQVAYTQMPAPTIHMLWLLMNMLAFVLPWEYVSVCKWYTSLISLVITIAFFGILRITNEMENPFGCDEDDIPIWEVAEHLDEEICLIMFYSALDEVGGENLYRSMFRQQHIYLEPKTRL